MVAVASRPIPAIGPASYSNVMLLYAGSMLLSAALLFGVQPMFARMSLPLLGGSTSVWAIALCFFQGALLAGYAYAHISNRLLSPSGAIITHVALIYAAFNFLPLAPPEPLDSAGNAGLQLFWTFTKTIGLPFVVLSATAPLLQGWFLRTGHPKSVNPYRLYAASNIGSIGALLIYPFVVEPLTGLSAQASAWHWGFLLLALGIIACGYAQLQASQLPASHIKAEPVQWRARMSWVSLSFITSGLLAAWTNRITSDLASAPFLWLPPLALYLLTFVLTFRRRPAITIEQARFYQVLFLPLAYLAPTMSGGLLVVGLLMSGAVTVFMTTLICHRLVYENRPQVSRLTEFYMLISLGGVLGGSFVSLLSPVLFTSIAEYPILLMTGLLATSGLLTKDAAHHLERRRYLLFCAIALILTAWGFAQSMLHYRSENAFELLALNLITVVLFAAARPWHAIAVTLTTVFLFSQHAPEKLLAMRNYYGTLTVTDTALPGYRIFAHGTTIHGAQNMLDIDPLNQRRPLALTYYSEKGGISRSLRATQDALRLAGRQGDYGIVGLGVGSVACFTESSDRMTFFEIDRDVTAIARNPEYFTFLSKCAPNASVIDGDARLSLGAIPKKSYDYLLIDAFTSDTIPTHLLTREALQLYLSRLKDDGMLALHLSNRFMDLVPAVHATALTIGEQLQIRLIDHRPMAGERSAIRSIVLVISRSAERIAFLPPAYDMTELRANDRLPAPWTDDYANLPAAILRQLSK